MNVTVVGLVTPHVLRVVDLANEAEKGVNVDWYLRGAVTKTLSDLGQLYNGPELIAAYIQGLENAAVQAPKNRPGYARVLQDAAAAARNPR
jgi:hypothetical protein